MSVIARQSFKNSILKYFGVILGTVNVLFIYTFCFSAEQIGHLRYIQDTAVMLTTFFSLGVGSLTVRYFAKFKDEQNKHNGFLGLLVFLTLIGVVVYFFFLSIFQFFASENFNNNLWPITVMMISMLFMKVFTAYASNFKRIAIPEIYNNLFVKIGLPLLAVIYVFNWIDFNTVITGLELVYILAALGLVYYLSRLNQLHISRSFLKDIKAPWKEMAGYMVFGVLGGVGGVFASRIDIIMITEYYTFTETGVYSIALFIAGVINIPMSSIRAITAPIISEKITLEKFSEVDSVYKKASTNLLIIGALFFLLVYVNINELFSIMPNGDDYRSGAMVVLVVGLAKLVDLAASVNNEIILYSKYYRYATYFMLIMAAMNIVGNLILIPMYNIFGAGIATLIALSIHNFIKMMFIKKKFGFIPFTKNTGYVLLIGFASYGLMMLVPSTENHFVNVAINSVLICVIFMGPILYFKLSTDLNDALKKFRAYLRL